MKRVKVFALLASSIILLAACTNDSSDSAGPAPTSAAGPKATVVSPEERNNQQIGSAEYSLKVSAYEDPAIAAASYKPKLANSRLVAVEVTLENTKSKEVLDVTPTNLKLVDANGQTYEPFASGRDGEIKIASLKTGEKATGWVAFEIPKDLKPTKVRYLVGLLATVQLEAPMPAK